MGWEPISWTGCGLENRQNLILQTENFLIAYELHLRSMSDRIQTVVAAQAAEKRAVFARCS